MSKPAAQLAPGFFSSPVVHEREVQLPDGSKHMLCFRELSAVEFRKFQFAEQSNDENVRAGSIARMISLSLCDSDGKPVLDYKKALTLTPRATNALMEAVLDVNGFGPSSGNVSEGEEKSGSGTPSPSPLEDEPSQS